MRRLVLLLSLLALGPACSSTPPPLVDAQGYLSGDDGTRPRKITTIRPFVAEDAALVVVRGRSRDPRHAAFFVKMLQENPRFPRVWSQKRLDEMASARGLAGSPQLLANRTGLASATAQFGHFLLLEPRVERMDGANYRAMLDVTDSATGERVLHAVHAARDWTDIEEPLLHPIYNAFVDWTNGVAVDR